MTLTDTPPARCRHGILHAHLVCDICRAEHAAGNGQRPESTGAAGAADTGTPPPQVTALTAQPRDTGTTPGVTAAGVAEQPAAAAAVTRLADVTPEHVQWLWDGWLPCGKLVTLDGDPGLGKSTLAVTFAAHVSTGTPWPDGSPCPQGGVLLLSAEDGLADTIRPRMDAAGGDSSRVYALTGVPAVAGDDTLHYRPPVIPRDVPLVAELVTRYRVRLVVVDVLMAYLDGQVNAHRDQDVRRALAPLAGLADRTGATVLVLRHLNKATGGPVLYRGGGSIGIVGAARVGLVTVLDPDDDTEQRRVLAVSKNNLAPLPTARTYQLTPDPGSGVARVSWLGEDVRRLDDLMGHHASPDERHEQDDIAAQVVDYLTQRGGTATASEVLRELTTAGYPKHTVQRARKRAGVRTVKDGMHGGWLWTLTSPRHPEGDTEGDEDSSTQGSAPSSPSSHLRRTCQGCGGPLTACEPGQTHHPLCAPED